MSVTITIMLYQFIYFQTRVPSLKIHKHVIDTENYIFNR